ncbi:MAG: hypothetical protein IV086_03460 [Hyphomonadaceae bacterium]|nr:hypothetical protein [Hyphomonadaceae bacterium]
MQILNPLHPHRASIEAFAQSMKLWLLELALWIVALTESRAGRIQLQHLIIEARQDIRVLIALKMGLRLRIHTGRRLATGRGQHAAPPGFAVQTRTGRRLRLFTRSIALGSIRDMQHALNHLEDVVTRALARLPKSIARMSIVIAAPMADALCIAALTHAPEGADTS